MQNGLFGFNDLSAGKQNAFDETAYEIDWGEIETHYINAFFELR